MLCGRGEEQAVIDRLLAGARSGSSGTLIVRGEPGIGKTALLEYAVASASGMRVLRSAGVESEAELPFAGLHLLLGGALDCLPRLPGPQRRALEGAFGLASAQPGDGLFVGLAVLSLLSELAEDGPLLCVVDDAQWLDRASAGALLLAARRLHAEGVALLVAARDGEDTAIAPGLPELTLTGLSAVDAAALLDAQGGELAAGVRHRVLTESGGNPLALLELPAALAGQGHGGAVRTGSLPLTTRLRIAFHGQASRLPPATQTMLLLAAAGGDGLGTILRAAASFGAGLADLAAAERAGLVRVTDQAVTFRHSLVRAAVYQGAPLARRLAAHEALAEVLDTPAEADRRSWHLASAVTGPDEQVATELEGAAVRAGQRSGYAAAAAAYARAAQLSVDPIACARRLTLAAEAAGEVGDLDYARELAERAAGRGDDTALLARLAHVRAAADFGQGALHAAFAQLCTGVDLVSNDEPHRTLWMLTDMVFLSWHADDRDLAATTGARLDSLPLPATDPLAPHHDLLRWLLMLASDRPADGLPRLPDVMARAARTASANLRGLLLTVAAALVLGDDARAAELAAAVSRTARHQGRIGLLAPALVYLAWTRFTLGNHRDALTMAAEAARMAQDTEQHEWHSQANSVLACLAAVTGDQQRCRETAKVAIRDATTPNSIGALAGRWALGLLELGLGRAGTALAHLETFTQGTLRCQLPIIRSTPDLIESAVRLGEPARAAEPFDRLAAFAAHSGQPWLNALVLRCTALLATDEDAEQHYLGALALRDDTHPMDAARTQLLYGEWLRRARRRSDARRHLREALHTFDRLGAEPWADRARAELNAIGGAAATGRASGALAGLTPQELQIVRLAASGMSNRDIAAQLFLSPRTVGYHLYKAYPKLGVTSRAELPAVAGD
ncbi:LuxR family transcriptional regulator [Amycolatopsis taiwanensis]|uniref:Transcriptional regulator n=1 Tax=Amycolatopsis taiwanensis TaxID=342230 RepID=A0A9W6VFY1_9PSEU|nr:LuxR family transcriptional regulator [Amycolatopsis taiwanensis]GLY70133.1 transcriptional regulator [Amycolatopsis taiwanensis]